VPESLTTHDHDPVSSRKSDPPGGRWFLLIDVPSEGRMLSVEVRGVVSVGRAESCEVSIQEPSLSRMHASFRAAAEGVFVADLGSRNGVIVDGQKVDELLLRPGQAAALGSVTVTVHAATSSLDLALGVQPYAAFLSALTGEIERAHTVSRPLGLLFVRTAGSGSMVEVVNALRTKKQPIDLLGRYGADTLIWALPERDADESERIAAELSGQGALFGVAAYPLSGGSAQELVSAAQDEASRATTAHPVRRAARRPEVREAEAASGVARVSSAMRALDLMIDRIAPRALPVLINGETGSGKEHAARALHERSPRAKKPLRAVNCGAIASSLLESFLFGHERGAFTGADKLRVGVFEEANGGTVFLDEVGELSQPAQAALLRVLESRTIVRVGSSREIPVDVRVVAATHRDLEGMVERGEFRLDLLHRLNAVVLRVPPLRERVEEIKPLTQHFLSEAARNWNTSAPAIDAAVWTELEGYGWPGNVRELRNVIERALALCDGVTLGVADLPDHVRAQRATAATATLQSLAPASSRHRDRLREQELQSIRDALVRTGGNRTEAAKLIGMPLRTLQRRLAELGKGEGEEG